MRRSQTLSRTRDVHEVFAAGARIRGDLVTVFVRKRAAGGLPTRLGVAARVRRRAVVRNRVKRRLRAAFVDYRPGPGYDVVLRADERAAECSYDDLLKGLTGALRAAGVGEDKP